MPSKNNNKQQSFLNKITSQTPLIANMQAGTITPATLAAIQAINSSLRHKYTIDTIEQLLPLLPNMPDPGHVAIFREYQRLQRHQNAGKKWEKRQFVKSLNLMSPAPLAAQMGLPILVRDRDIVPCVKARVTIVDRGNQQFISPKNRKNMQVIGVGTLWKKVKSDESIIIQNTQGEIELVVIRNISGSPPLLQSMNTIIETATRYQRNVRPNHPGTMVQLGYNAGPRHCRIFGLVNNFKSAKLALEVKGQQDEQAIGALSFFWHLVQSHAPHEVVHSVETAIEMSGMPEINSRFGRDLPGYSITVNDQEFNFPTVTKGPCEGYFATNYVAPTHSDPCFADYAFAWSTRHVSLCTLQSNHSTGGNFADISLRILVESAADTLLIFKPGYRHGTTVARPTTSRAGMVIAFSTHIKRAYDIAMANALKGKSAKLISKRMSGKN